MRTAQQHHHLPVHCPLSFVKSFIPFRFQIFELNHIFIFMFWSHWSSLSWSSGPGGQLDTSRKVSTTAWSSWSLHLSGRHIPPASKHHWGPFSSHEIWSGIQELMWGKNVNYPRFAGEMCGQLNKKLYKLFSLHQDTLNQPDHQFSCLF